MRGYLVFILAFLIMVIGTGFMASCARASTIGEQINNGWADTLMEGDVSDISHINTVERRLGCTLMVQAHGTDSYGCRILAWEIYDTCKDESIDMGMVLLNNQCD